MIYCWYNGAPIYSLNAVLVLRRRIINIEEGERIENAEKARRAAKGYGRIWKAMRNHEMT